MLVLSRLIGQSVVIQTPDPITLTLVSIDPLGVTATFDVRRGGRVEGLTLAENRAVRLDQDVSVLFRFRGSRVKVGVQCSRAFRVDRGEVVDRRRLTS